MADLEHQLPDRLARFAQALRDAGLEADTAATLTFATALSKLGADDVYSIYWAGRLSFVKSEIQIPDYDRIFHAFVSPNAGGAPPVVEMQNAPSRSETDRDEVAPEAPSEGSGLAASSTPGLRNKNFEELSADEQRVLTRLIEQLAIEPPTRTSRRTRPATRGDVLDLRKMLTSSMRTEGEPVQRYWQRPKITPRRVVFLVDVSGSMRAYSRTLLKFAYVLRKKYRRTEVFCFGTSITRVSDELDHPTTDQALQRVGHAISDWEGGTHIAESIERFLIRWGRRGAARGAVIVICSDGLERGDPSALGLQMSRLKRLAHQIVWLNPLKGGTGYEPLARGMAAALPYIDRFLAGHDLASLESLAGALAGDRR